jgi:hypothetical protein
MPEYLFEDVELALSKQAETALNTHYSAISDFQRILTAQPVVPIPTPEKASDAGRVGNGHEFITPGRLCNTYWQQPNLTIEDDLDFDLSGKLMRRALGSVVTPTTIGAFIAKSFKLLPKSSGLQLPSSTVIARLGGADFLHAGMVVQQYRMFQQGNDRPRYSATLQGTGKFVNPSPVGTLTVPTYICPSGNHVLIQWTDSGGVRDLTGSGCNISAWSVEISTELRDKRCAGDPTLSAPACASAGAAYRRSLTRRNRTITAQITYKLDSTLPEWAMMVCNELVTDVIFRVGANANGLLATDVMQEAVFPKAYLSTIEIVDDDGDAAQQITLTPALSLHSFFKFMNQARPFHQGLQRAITAPECDPSGQAVLFAIEVSAQAPQCQCNFADGRQRTLGFSGQDLQFQFAQTAGCGRCLWDQARAFAQLQQTQGDDTQQGDRRHQFGPGFQLQFFNPQAGFERLMKFFHHPARRVLQGDGQGLGARRNVRVAQQNPFEGFAACRRRGFPHADDRTGDRRLRAPSVPGVPGRTQRHPRHAQAQPRGPRGLSIPRAQDQVEFPPTGLLACGRKQPPRRSPVGVHQRAILGGAHDVAVPFGRATAQEFVNIRAAITDANPADRVRCGGGSQARRGRFPEGRFPRAQQARVPRFARRDTFPHDHLLVGQADEFQRRVPSLRLRHTVCRPAQGQRVMQLKTLPSRVLVTDRPQPRTFGFAAPGRLGRILDQQIRARLLQPRQHQFPMRRLQFIRRHFRVGKELVGGLDVIPTPAGLRNTVARLRGKRGGDPHRPLIAFLVPQIQLAELLFGPRLGSETR